MTVGIIIPTFEHFEYAKLAIESAAQTPDSLIIVVDDGSPHWPGERIVRGWLPRSTPFVIQRFDQNRRNLSRSWNAGIRIARGLGLDYVVAGNADLVFARGWWGPIEAALAGDHFVGPVTNAPGHVRAQDVRRYLTDYDVDDDPDAIDDIQRRLQGGILPSIPRVPLNGYCIAGRTDAFDAIRFDESIPMRGNEDDFFRRAGSQGMTARVVPTSFVFHYRSVARGLNSPHLDRGAARLRGCGACGRQ